MSGSAEREELLWNEVALDAEHAVYRSRLPGPAFAAPAEFERLWALRPAEFHELTMYGRKVKAPRWQQAFGVDYVYSGNVNRARPVPVLLAPLLHLMQRTVDPRLNGLLVNWYDGALGHYMGPHRDTISHLIPDTPIVTLSFGEERVFRLRPHRSRGAGRDLLLHHGDVVLLPWRTNRAWTHAVPRFARFTGHRVSVTLRCFEAASGP